MMKKIVVLIALIYCGTISAQKSQFPQIDNIDSFKAGDLIIVAGISKNKRYKDYQKKISTTFGTLIVPENRTKSDSRLMTLPVVKLHSFNENPGEPEDYQFTCLALKDPKTLGFCDSLIRAFEVSKLDGHRVYSVLFGGVMWAHWVSSHTLNRQVPPCFQKDGTLIIAVQDWDKNFSIQDLAKHV